MHRVAIVGFDGFTDIDLFLAWDLFCRVDVPGWKVEIVAPTERIASSTGLSIARHAPLETASSADAVYFASGAGSRALAESPVLHEALRLDPARQVLAAVDSGTLLLAALGHLRGLRATTYPGDELRALITRHGVEVVQEALVIEGTIGTAAQCLAGVGLVHWVITRLVGEEAAERAIASARPL
jgi:transcriptional regulator GlxA family with amidase domain